MKKALYIIETAALTVSAVSCEDFLTKEPVSSLTAGNFWQSSEDVQAARAAMYSAFATAMKQNFFNWGELRGRTFGADASLGVGSLQLISHIIDDTHSSAKWTDLYATINRANLLIKYVPGMSTVDKQTLAEAYTMRALAYFYAVRVWGDVPLFLDAVEEYDVNTCLKARESEDVVLAQIESDIETAIATFPPFNTSLSISTLSRTHLNLAAAQALKMDVQMWQHKWDDAIRTFENGVSDLPSNWFFFKVFSSIETGASDANIKNWRKIVMDDTTDREVFFAVHYDKDQDATENNTRKMFCADGQPLTVNTKTVESFQSGDIRLPGTFYRAGSDAKYKLEKFWDLKNSTVKDHPSDNDLIMYRYTDILLLYAEALNRQTRLSEAVGIVNQIRARAGLEELDPEISKADLDDEILYERHMELIGEGKYWFDLIRTENYEKIASCPKVRIHWPVHHDHLVQNPNLKQNDYSE